MTTSLHNSNHFNKSCNTTTSPLPTFVFSLTVPARTTWWLRCGTGGRGWEGRSCGWPGCSPSGGWPSAGRCCCCSPRSSAAPSSTPSCSSGQWPAGSDRWPAWWWRFYHYWPAARSAAVREQWLLSAPETRNMFTKFSEFSNIKDSVWQIFPKELLATGSVGLWFFISRSSLSTSPNIL